MPESAEDLVRARFPSPEAALGFDALVLDTVSTLQGMAELVLGPSRAVVLAPGINTGCDRSIRYLSSRAHRFALHMGARYVAEDWISRTQIPSGTVLVVGLEEDRPRWRRKAQMEAV